MDELTDEEIAKLFGLARISFGVMAFVAPRWAARVWTWRGHHGNHRRDGSAQSRGQRRRVGIGTCSSRSKHGWSGPGMARGRRVVGCGRRLEHADVAPWVAQDAFYYSMAASGGGVFLGRRLAETLD